MRSLFDRFADGAQPPPPPRSRTAAAAAAAAAVSLREDKARLNIAGFVRLLSAVGVLGPRLSVLKSVQARTAQHSTQARSCRWDIPHASSAAH